MTSPRTTSAASPVLSEQDLELLLFLATSAPSVHNTQPWSFELTQTGLLLRTDPTRQLPVLDPEGRQAVLSCGAALHHLLVGARGLGLDASVDLLPHEGVLAHVSLQPGTPPTQEQRRRSTAILVRHTHRLRFTDAAVPSTVLTALTHVAEREGAMARTIRPSELTDVAVLVSRAEEELERRPDYVAELKQWVWDAETRDRPDGLPRAAVDHGTGRAESLVGRSFDGLPLPRPSEPPAPEPATVLLLTSEGDGPLDWLRSGMALSAVLLEATLCGLQAQPIGQVIDIQETRWALRSALGVVGVPQMLLRLGYGHSEPRTARRPVSDVLTVKVP